MFTGSAYTLAADVDFIGGRCDANRSWVMYSGAVLIVEEPLDFQNTGRSIRHRGQWKRICDKMDRAHDALASKKR